MHYRSHLTLSILALLFQSAAGALVADDSVSPSIEGIEKAQTQPFEAFTGRIMKNKVRMRLQPSLDAPILQEFVRDDLLMVVGDADEFYAILPPKESKAYIFRTFVLDNKVEGNKVNVRLEPALEAPVIAQLHSGDEINGVISPLNSKWLEIAPPASTRFYVCKEYVEKIGSPAVMAQLEKRREEVNELLNHSYLISQQELEKNYSDMKIDTAIAGFKKIIKDYSDFPDQSARAKELLANLQETLLQKKIEYLEAKAAGKEITSATNFKSQLKDDSFPVDQKKAANNQSGAPSENDEAALPNWNKIFDPTAMTPKMSAWISNEKALYDAWAAYQDEPTPEAFYEQQIAQIATITGILEPYSRTVKNKPGDFLLVSSTSNFPIAYLYSTSVNLQDKLGHVTTVHAVKRPNNNFAFPAYFVISVE